MNRKYSTEVIEDVEAPNVGHVQRVLLTNDVADESIVQIFTRFVERSTVTFVERIKENSIFEKKFILFERFFLSDSAIFTSGYEV